MATLIQNLEYRIKQDAEQYDAIVRLTEKVNQPEIKKLLLEGLNQGINCRIKYKNTHIELLTAAEPNYPPRYTFIIRKYNESVFATHFIFNTESDRFTVKLRDYEWTLKKKSDEYLDVILGLKQQPSFLHKVLTFFKKGHSV